MTRRRSCKTVRGQNIRELKEQVGDTLGSGEERCLEQEYEDRGDEVNKMAGELGEELMYTFWLVKAPRIGTETVASWKNQSKLQEPKCRGIILEPEHKNEEPSSVRSLTPEKVDEAGARNTKTEAPKSIRKC